jgi:hypothetical protein
MFDALLRGDYGLAPTNLPNLALGVLLAFLSGQAIAWVYMFTHLGLSYSRSFVVSLILMPVIVAVVMTVLTNSLVTAFGMMAVFAVVRFRNILRDTLDTTYVLSVLVVGMACGTAKFTTAVFGCVAICLILIYVRFTGFGTRHRFDLVLNLSWHRPGGEIMDLNRLLDRHCRRVTRVNQKLAVDGAGMDYSFRLLMRDPDRADEMLSEIGALAGVNDVTSALVGDESEM